MTTCEIDNCPNYRYCRGWCKKHYARWLAHGDPTVTKRLTRSVCSVYDCSSYVHAHGYCSPHLYRFESYGDPLAEGPGQSTGRKRLAAPGYDAVHKRLSREKGKASAESCVDCGRRAHEWSYNGGCPNELYGGRGEARLAYSTDQSLYSPRCVRCHRGMDRSLRRNRDAAGRWAS